MLPLAGAASAAFLGIAVALSKTSGVNEAVPVRIETIKHERHCMNNDFHTYYLPNTSPVFMEAPADC